MHGLFKIIQNYVNNKTRSIIKKFLPCIFYRLSFMSHHHIQLDDEKSFPRLSEGMEHGQGIEKEAKKDGKWWLLA